MLKLKNSQNLIYITINTTIVGNEDAAKEIHEKAAQFDHHMNLTEVKVLSCKTSQEKIQYLTLCP